jgi:hypothetical protein
MQSLLSVSMFGPSVSFSSSGPKYDMSLMLLWTILTSQFITNINTNTADSRVCAVFSMMVPVVMDPELIDANGASKNTQTF